MKRMKKFLGIVMATSVVAAGIMSAGAAPSPTQTVPSDAVATVGGQEVTLNVSTADEVEWSDIVSDAAATTIIESVCDQSASDQEAITEMFGDATVKATSGAVMDLSSTKFLTPFYDLAFSTEVSTTDGFTVSWNQPQVIGLASTTAIFVAHYNVETEAFELIVPDSVDYATGKITATFTSLSPVAIIYDTEGSVPSTSASTQTAMVGIGCVAVLAIAGVVTATVVSKKRR